jgi:GNAT superfamily N-acetyltransferase
MIKIENAKTKNINFILKGIKEILETEKIEFTKKQKIELKKSIVKDIKRKEIKVAIKENKPVGFIWFKFSNKIPFGVNYGKMDEKYCWVNWTYVTKKFRNKGIGSALYKEIEKVCKKKGIETMMLDIFKVNKLSEKVHKKLGFKELLSIYTKKVS